MIELYVCGRLSATISERQCGINKKTMEACKGCSGLYGVPEKTVVQADTPPTVTLRFESPEDRKVYELIKTVGSNIEYDMISLLHLALRLRVDKAPAADRKLRSTKRGGARV